MFQIATISILAIAIAALGLILALQLTHLITKRPVEIRKLFIGLEPKLWMTAGLGCFFFSLYFGGVWLASRLIDPHARKALFNLVLQYPIHFVYGGLSLFVLISLSVLAIRGLIKRAYNSRKR